MISWPTRDTGPAPKESVSAPPGPPRKSPGMGSRREHVPMRLLCSLRGEGVLLIDSGETAVGYALDVFHDRMGQTASGTLEGPVAGDDFPAKAVLRLANGVELAVSLLEGDEDGAVFESRGGFTLEELNAAAPPRKRSRS